MANIITAKTYGIQITKSMPRGINQRYKSGLKKGLFLTAWGTRGNFKPFDTKITWRDTSLKHAKKQIELLGVKGYAEVVPLKLKPFGNEAPLQKK